MKLYPHGYITTSQRRSPHHISYKETKLSALAVTSDFRILLAVNVLQLQALFRGRSFGLAWNCAICRKLGLNCENLKLEY
jgi:hypothetical protein